MSQLPLTPVTPVPTSSHGTFTHPCDSAKVPVNLAKIKDVGTFCVGDKQDVTEVHNYLKHFGYLPPDASAPSADGVVGEGTSTAIKAFQQSVSLTVDGVFGPETRAAMSEARCGFPDLLQGVGFSVAGPWAERDLTFAFGNTSRQVTADVAKAALRRAMDTWTNAGVGLTFKEVAVDANPDFFIEWRPANDPDYNMVGGVLAHADFPPGFSIVVKQTPLPLHYDDEEHTWVDGAKANGFDIETTGLHEIGHILGLYHSSDPGAIMYPFSYPNTTRRELSLDDQLAIRNLYPSWASLSGTWPGNPTVCSWAEGRTDIFIRGTDGGVYHKFQDGSGTTWSPSQTGYESNISGVIYGNIAAVSMFQNHTDLYVLGLDNACWHNWWDGTQWGSWESLGGTFIGDMCAVSWGPKRMDIFARGMDNAVYHKIWNGTDWLPSKKGWENLGGLVIGGPKAVCWGPDRIDVVARGTDNQVLHKTWDGKVWQPSPTAWTNLGGSTIGDVTPVSWGPNRLDLFAQGADNKFYQKSWDGSAWVPPAAADWTGLGGGTWLSKPAAVAWGENRITVAGQGNDNAVWVKEWNGSSWSEWKSLGGLITDGPVLDPRGGERAAVYARGADAGLYVYE